MAAVAAHRRLKKGTTSKGKDSVSYKCVLSPRVAEIVHHHFLRAAAPRRRRAPSPVVRLPARTLTAHAFFALGKKS